MSLTSGTRLGPYEIAAHIGAGGRGEVYRALDSNLGRQVANQATTTKDDKVVLILNFFDELRRVAPATRAS